MNQCFNLQVEGGCTIKAVDIGKILSHSFWQVADDVLGPK